MEDPPVEPTPAPKGMFGDCHESRMPMTNFVQPTAPAQTRSLPTLPWDARRRQNRPGRPCLSYPVQFSADSNGQVPCWFEVGVAGGCPIKQSGYEAHSKGTHSYNLLRVLDR